jgi:hypothetical protein
LLKILIVRFLPSIGFRISTPEELGRCSDALAQYVAWPPGCAFEHPFRETAIITPLVEKLLLQPPPTEDEACGSECKQ